MTSIVFWSTAVLVSLAAALDLRSRRIPNWLTLPFLMAGLVFGTMRNGLTGLEASVEGVCLAVATLGLFCLRKGLGMGDLKLCAAVGAWIGFAQLGVALVVTAMAGGLMAFLYAARQGAVLKSIDGASEVLNGLCGASPRNEVSHSGPGKLSIPYAPAIAAGTLFSFLCAGAK